MIAHLRAIGMLLVLTVCICSVAYPLAVLAVGQTIFPFQASGSIAAGSDGKPIGSRLIAQEFKGDEWFQPRPSAAGYNAAASSGSNFGANNPKLRDRVARQLGPIVQYTSGTRAGKLVETDIERWFAAKPERTAEWARRFPTLAAAWLKDNAEAVAAWEKTQASSDATGFFERYSRAHPSTWPAVVEKKIQPTSTGPDVQAAFFEMWLQGNGSVDLQSVPADQVTTSGSGLDPHITLRNARGQVDRVTKAWSEKKSGSEASIRQLVNTTLDEFAFTPLLGLAGGESLVNVLDINRALAERLAQSSR